MSEVQSVHGMGGGTQAKVMAPPVLCMQLQRGVERYVNGVPRKWKINNRIWVPMDLTWVDSEYRLVGVVQHVGDYLDAGHYVSAVRECCGEDREWRMYDDGTVTVVEERVVLRMEANLLVYVRETDGVLP